MADPGLAVNCPRCGAPLVYVRTDGSDATSKRRRKPSKISTLLQNLRKKGVELDEILKIHKRVKAANLSP